MKTHLTKPCTFVAAIMVSALLALGATNTMARIPASTVTKPVSVETALDANGFIQRWLLLEPIDANGLTDSAVQAAIQKDSLADQSMGVPRDGDRVTIGGAELTWHAVD